MTDAEFERAARAAMALLRHLHAWGAAHEELPEGTAAGRLLQLPDPLSSSQAVLALLSSLTKRHSIALKVSSPEHAVIHPSALGFLPAGSCSHRAGQCKVPCREADCCGVQPELQ